MKRSTRVLEHPDGSFTVEILVTTHVITGMGPLEIPKERKEWVRDPGFAVRLAFGLIGQHVDPEQAAQRAAFLTTCEEEGIYAKVFLTHLRDEDQTPKGQVN
jgi:hypothetical protein